MIWSHSKFTSIKDRLWVLENKFYKQDKYMRKVGLHMFPAYIASNKTGCEGKAFVVNPVCHEHIGYAT